MNLCTISFNFYPGYVMSICIVDDLKLLESSTIQPLYKLIFIKGDSSFISINSNEYMLVGDYLLCLNENDTIRFLNVAGCEITGLLFHPSVINVKFNFVICNTENDLAITDIQDLFYLARFKHSASNSDKLISLDSFHTTIIKEKLQGIKEQITLQETSGWPCYTRAYLLEILFSLVKPSSQELAVYSPCTLETYPKLTSNVILYLQTHYDEKITLVGLVQHFNTNRTTLLNEFKEATGISLIKYLQQLRIKIASSLLRNTDLTIMEICERTGFSDISYFSKAFKKEINYTPSQYRQVNA